MLEAPLFRQTNALATHLASSLCVFKVHAPPGTAADALAPRALTQACAGIGALLDVEPTADDVTLTLAVSHATVDAFGGMYLVARDVALPASSAGDVAREGRAGTFDYAHFTCEAARGEHPRTYTQRVVAAMLDVLADAAGARVALVVAKDDPARVGESTFLGNSLVMLEMSADELRELAGAPKERWRAAVSKQSDRIRAIALRRPELLRRTGAALTFSSVGDVLRIPWAAALDPSVFEMVPTPPAPDGATIVHWGRGARQALTICAKSDHPAMRMRGALRDAWRRASGT